MKTAMGEAVRRSKRRERRRRKRRERLKRARSKAKHKDEHWEDLRAWAGGTCVRCGRERHLQKDHIEPLCMGGSDGIDNLQPICMRCNSAKGPETINWILRDDYVE